jgi:hypothetical protein
VAQAFADFAVGGGRRAAYGRAGFRDRDRSATQLAKTDTVAKTVPDPGAAGCGPDGAGAGPLAALRRPANVLAAIDTSLHGGAGRRGCR